MKIIINYNNDDIQRQKIKSLCIKGVEGRVTGSIYPPQYPTIPPTEQTKSLRLVKATPFSLSIVILWKQQYFSQSLNYFATDLRLKVDLKVERFRDSQFNFCQWCYTVFWNTFGTFAFVFSIHPFTSFKSETSLLN